MTLQTISLPRQLQLTYLVTLPNTVGKIMIGTALGVSFGVWSIVNTLIAPLAEDDAPSLLGFYGPMFGLWAFIAFRSCKSTNRLLEAIRSGFLLGAITIFVFSLMAFIRVNLFLETLAIARIGEI
jgi:hypothetical protein